ncbi:ester cyclase [Mesorhizobium sp. B2-3-5]|uniref:ester cyclase n=1 Tax=Mesorhizobium sp. B2-3-5 TaxID=2589958 RepID=UPI0015E31027|nr:ester cyclase [Mesorhizobium sp. B2-3-5]
MYNPSKSFRASLLALPLAVGATIAVASTAPAADAAQAASAASNASLAEPWRLLWNGDLSYTDKIISPDFVAHAAPITGSGGDTIHGRAALNAWISGIKSIFPDLDFQIEVGPIADRDHFVVRWRARGTYHGGFPGAPASSTGRKVTFTGTDTLRVKDGQLVEYWANADSLLFVQQLGIETVPGVVKATTAQ